MAKNKLSNLIVSVKMLNTDFINKYIINPGRSGEDNSVIVNYQLLLSNIFPLDPPNYFSIKYRLFCLSLIELLNFMIYQYVNQGVKSFQIMVRVQV